MDGRTSDDECVWGWQEEAEAVISDISFAVKSINVSNSLPITDSAVYLNIEILEGQKYCVEMSRCGFKIVSDKFDCMEDDYEDQRHYETSYALLHKYSRIFSQRFGEEVQNRLKELASQK